MNRGKYIIIEGGEGSGKTSEQLPRLAEYLERNHISFVKTHEPGGTEICDIYRDIVLGIREEELCSQAELLTYLAARAQLIAQVINPALKQGKWVICDRGYPSTVAYQGFGNRINLFKIEQFNRFVISHDGEKLIFPDLTFIIDVPVRKGLAKAMKKGLDRQESRGIEFHRRVYEGYQHYLSIDKEAVCISYIEDNPEEMHRRIVKVLEERFGI